MECNTGNLDRVVRFVVGFSLFLLGMVMHLAILSAIGLLILLTAITRFCFFYKWFKINTHCKKTDEVGLKEEQQQ